VARCCVQGGGEEEIARGTRPHGHGERYHKGIVYVINIYNNTPELKHSFVSFTLKRGFLAQMPVAMRL
jgi:hypothetical protein